MVGGEEEDGWPFAASLIYTAAWCISFYGQIYENYKLKSYIPDYPAWKASPSTTWPSTSPAIPSTPSTLPSAISQISQVPALSSWPTSSSSTTPFLWSHFKATNASSIQYQS